MAAPSNDEAKIHLHLDTKGAKASTNDLKEDIKKLKKALDDLTPGTEKFIETSKKLAQVEAQMADIKKQSREAGDAIRKASGDVRKMGDEYKAVGKEVTGFGAIFKGTFAAGLLDRAIDTVFNFVSGARQAFMEGRKETAQMEQSLKSTGHAAGVTATEIKNLTSALQDQTNIDDDLTNGATSLLLTFTNIKDEVLKETIPIMQDMSVKMGTDMSSSAIQLGKALNDPIKGISALSRVGVSFSGEQEKMIEQMMKAGDVAGAQRIILAELNKEFGGSAKAAAEVGGESERLKMKFEDLEEAVGGKLNEGMNGIAGGLTSIVEVATDVVENFEPVEDVFSDLYSVLGNLFSSIGDVVTSIFGLNKEGNNTGMIMKGIATVLQMGVDVIRVFASTVIFGAESLGVLINKGKEVANFFGADFKIDPNATFEKAFTKYNSSLNDIGKNVEKIWTDNTKVVEEETAKQSKATREASKEELDRAEKEHQKLRKAFEKLQKDISKTRDDETFLRISKEEAEFRKIEEKYQEHLDELNNIYKKGGISTNEFLDVRSEINADEEREKMVLRFKLNEERKAENQKLLDALYQQAVDHQSKIDQLDLGNREAEIDQTRSFYDALIQQANGHTDTIKALKTLQLNDLAIISGKYAMKEVQDNEIKNRQIQAQEQQLYQAKMDALSAFSSLARQSAQMIAANGGKLNEFQKGLALVAIAIDTAKALSTAIAGAIEASTAEGPYGIYLAAANIALAVGTVLTAYGQVKSVLKSTDTPATPSFFFGGYTDNAPVMGSDQYGTIRGYTHDGEYVINKKQMQDPFVANFAGYLEARRTGKGFAEGGPVDMPPSRGNGFSPVSGGAEQLLIASQNMLLAAQEILQAARTFPREATINYQRYEDTQNKVNTIIERATIK